MEAAHRMFITRLNRVLALRGRLEYPRAYNPLTRQGAQGADISFKGLRVHSTHKG